MRADAERGVARGPAVGRNDPCPCGSGKRYKQCHGAHGAAARCRPARDAAALVRAGAERSPRRATSTRPSALTGRRSRSRPATRWRDALPRRDRYYQRGNLGEALPRLERTVAAHSGRTRFPREPGTRATPRRTGSTTRSPRYRRALALAPDHAGALNNLGLALQEQNRRQEADRRVPPALAVDPEPSRIATGTSRWHASRSAIADGWRDYECAPVGPRARRRAPPIPACRGSTRSTFAAARSSWSASRVSATRSSSRATHPRSPHAARASSCARRRASRASLRTVPGVAEVVARDARPRCDAWLPLASLPGLLGASPSGDPAAIPYLHADPALASMVRGELGERRGRLRAGLAWAGNPRARERPPPVLPLAALAPLLARTDVDWYSLQRGRWRGPDRARPGGSAPAPPRRAQRFRRQGRADRCARPRRQRRHQHRAPRRRARPAGVDPAAFAPGLAVGRRRRATRLVSDRDAVPPARAPATGRRSSPTSCARSTTCPPRSPLDEPAEVTQRPVPLRQRQALQALPRRRRPAGRPLPPRCQPMRRIRSRWLALRSAPDGMRKPPASSSRITARRLRTSPRSKSSPRRCDPPTPRDRANAGSARTAKRPTIPRRCSSSANSAARRASPRGRSRCSSARWRSRPTIPRCSTTWASR